MKVRILCTVLFFLPGLFPLPAYPVTDSYFLSHSSTVSVKNEGQISPREDSKEGSPQAIEEYEREKLARLKRNIGRRLLTDRTIKPAEFYESPDELHRTLKIKREKEGFVITEVVQNKSGTMNFYKVTLDTGQTGYLSADGNYLELKIKERSLLSVPKRADRKSVSKWKGLASEAIERVKNHPTLADPVTGEKRSVEKRMRDQRAKSFPYPRWRYEAKEIGGKRFRVIQHVEERAAPPFIRTWIVDLSTPEVRPENPAAKEMYR